MKLDGQGEPARPCFLLLGGPAISGCSALRARGKAAGLHMSAVSLRGGGLDTGCGGRGHRGLAGSSLRAFCHGHFPFKLLIGTSFDGGAVLLEPPSDQNS